MTNLLLAAIPFGTGCFTARGGTARLARQPFGRVAKPTPRMKDTMIQLRDLEKSYATGYASGPSKH